MDWVKIVCPSVCQCVDRSAVLCLGLPSVCLSVRLSVCVCVTRSFFHEKMRMPGWTRRQDSTTRSTPLSSTKCSNEASSLKAKRQKGSTERVIENDSTFLMTLCRSSAGCTSVMSKLMRYVASSSGTPPSPHLAFFCVK